VYFEEGTTVTPFSPFRVAMSNSRTFVGDLTEGQTYTFAVTAVDMSGNEGPLSAPYTVTFKAP
jgi:hypothetical protein